MGMLVLKIWLIGFVLHFLLLVGLLMWEQRKPNVSNMMVLSSLIDPVGTMMSFSIASAVWPLNVAFMLFMMIRRTWIFNRCPKDE